MKNILLITTILLFLVSCTNSNQNYGEKTNKLPKVDAPIIVDDLNEGQQDPLESEEAAEVVEEPKKTVPEESEDSATSTIKEATPVIEGLSISEEEKKQRLEEEKKIEEEVMRISREDAKADEAEAMRIAEEEDKKTAASE